VCIGNSCRSQIAEALVRHMAADVIEPSSAGTAALGSIASSTVQVLAERGIRVDGQYSKQLRAEDGQAADLIINMTGQPGTLLFPEEAAKVEDWKVPDPYWADLELQRQVRENIAARIAQVAERLRQQQGKEADCGAKKPASRGKTT